MIFSLVVFTVFALVGVHCDSHRHHHHHDHPFLEHAEHLKFHEREHHAEHFEEAKNLYFEKMVDYYLKDPNTKWERECFAKFKKADSVDIVIDIAASPELDNVDKMCAESPVGLYLQLWRHRSPSYSYFKSIGVFIDGVTLDMKPENTHTVIYDNKRKFYIRGKHITEGFKDHGEFADVSRNLKTLWPVDTKSFPETHVKQILVNNLGRMTKLALWNRDNGLPTVLNGSRRSKPIYTIVLTDGASGAKLEELTSDLARTTVIDIGNHRFIKNLKWDEIRKIVNVVPLTAPQALPAMIDSVRHMACLLSEHEPSD
jgi:hypothetical protein